MTVRSDPAVVDELARAYADANDRYQRALAEAESARRERDGYFVGFVEQDMLQREIAEVIGEPVGRVSQMIARERWIAWREREAKC